MDLFVAEEFQAEAKSVHLCEEAQGTEDKQGVLRSPSLCLKKNKTEWAYQLNSNQADTLHH